MRSIAAAAAVAAAVLSAVATASSAGFLARESPSPKFDDKAYGSDWHEEWKGGKYPDWKQTYGEAWPGNKSVRKFEDEQSDGKPSSGLTGQHVGAYLKGHKDGTIER